MTVSGGVDSVGVTCDHSVDAGPQGEVATRKFGDGVRVDDAASPGAFVHLGEPEGAEHRPSSSAPASGQQAQV